MEWSSPNAVLGPTMGDVGMCRCVFAMELYASMSPACLSDSACS
jgi:hypothetical protein